MFSLLGAQVKPGNPPGLKYTGETLTIIIGKCPRSIREDKKKVLENVVSDLEASHCKAFYKELLTSFILKS